MARLGSLDDTVQRIVSSLSPNEGRIFSEMCELLGKVIDVTPDDAVVQIYDDLNLSDDLAMHIKEEEAREIALQDVLNGSDAAFETLPVYLRLGIGSSNVIRAISQELKNRGINAEQNLYCFIAAQDKNDHLSPLMVYLTLCKYRVSGQVSVGETLVLRTISHFEENWHDRLNKMGS